MRNFTNPNFAALFNKLCFVAAMVFVISNVYPQSGILMPPTSKEIDHLNRQAFPLSRNRVESEEIREFKPLSTARIETDLVWEKMTKESEGGDAQDIVKVGNKLFMSSNYELFVSTDEGSSWTYLFNASQILLKGYLPNYYYATDKQILVSGDSILFGQKFSTDKGNTWSSVTINQAALPSPYFTPTFLRIHGKEMYLGTYYSGFLKSEDLGQTFTAVNNGLNAPYGFYEIPRLIEYYNGRPVIATVQGNIYSWDNIGWVKHAGNGLVGTVINVGPPINIIGGMDFVGNTWLASTNFGLFYSSDEGENWQKFTNLPDLPVIKPWNLFSQPAIYYNVDVFGNTIYVSFENNIWISSDSGLHWTHSQIDQKVNVARIFSGGTYLLAVTSAGVYKSVNNAVTWQKSNAGFERMAFGPIKYNGKDAFLSSARGGMFHSTDGGISWNPMNSGLNSTGTYVNAINGSIAIGSTLKAYQYGGITESYNSTIFKTDFSSQQWTQENPWPYDRIFALAISPSGKYAMLGSLNDSYQYGVQLSSDAGQSWHNMFSGITSNGLEENAGSAVLYDGDTLYLGTEYSGIYKSWDDGNHWTSITSAANGWDLPTSYGDLGVNEKVIQVDQIKKDKNHLYARASLVSSNEALFHSSDWGKTWSRLDLSGLTIAPYKIYIDNFTIGQDGKIFAICWVNGSNGSYVRAGIFVSADHGATWKQYGNEFPDQYPSQIEAVGGYIYASSPYGLWRIPQGDVKSVSLYAGSVKQPSGSEVSLPIKANSFTNVLSTQFSLKWNPAVATYLGISFNGTKGVDALSFGTTLANKGQLTFSLTGDNESPLNLPDSSALFFVRMKLVGMPGDTTSMKINGLPLSILTVNTNHVAVNTTARAGSIQIGQLIASVSKEQTKLVCFPVPFEKRLTVQFESEAPGLTNLTMIDALGRPIDSMNISTMAGTNTWVWDKGDQYPPGVYILDLRTAEKSVKVKVVKR